MRTRRNKPYVRAFVRALALESSYDPRWKRGHIPRGYLERHVRDPETIPAVG